MVTKTLFKKYTSAKDWAKADIHQIESDIKSTGFFRNKAKNIKGACTKVIEDFDGKMDLPGVASEAKLWEKEPGVLVITNPQPDNRLAVLTYVGTSDHYTAEIRMFAEDSGIGWYWIPIPWQGKAETSSGHNDGAKRWKGAWKFDPVMRRSSTSTQDSNG